MSQESVSVSGEVLQSQQSTEPTEHVDVDSDEHAESSHKAEQFGVGLSIGFLLGGISGVAVGSFPVAILLGLSLGVVLGLYMMERR
ncbi:hypothetical protein KU306_14800 [Haloferax larsenii]|uniref:Glycine zipper-like domain-containing protein n=1 Tax=Haloferax larsenii TaxID=302484 RepID=A0ABY5RFC3_HALLR|nr:hypothetical protein [Haloferax larsenii]ELZ78579.1 hypothetical protein C455_12868 [Haloferax larsenii JCM 13917]UVE50153.1 hypothetical protein KU306_14800 [Haloferax larsenii]